MAFFVKAVRQGTDLGEDIKELRVRAGLSIEEAARQTKIVPSIIRAWEESRWSSLGRDTIHLERLFRQYLQFLGAREVYFLKQYRDALEKAGVQHLETPALRDTQPLHLFDVAWMARARTAVFVILIFVGLGGYLVAQARGISAAPELTIDGPDEAVRVSEPHVHFSGITTPEAKVFLNGRPAIMQADGTFSLDLDIPRGTTEVTIVARRRYGKEVTALRRVIFERASTVGKETQEL